MSDSIPNKLDLLGFTKKWLDYGILTPERLDQEVVDFQNSGAYPHNAEHHRYGVLMDYLQKDSFDQQEIEHILEIAAEDSDRTMAFSVVFALIRCDQLTNEQFQELREHPLVKHFETSKIFLRHELLRLLNQHQLTDAIIQRCINEGDGTVHRQLLSRNVSYEVLVSLATRGANKAIRNMAQQRAQRKQ